MMQKFLDDLRVFHDRLTFHKSRDKAVSREGTYTFRKKDS